MLTTPARLLRLITLLSGRRAWSGAELAERLEVTARTLRRDVERLRSLGYPIHATAGAGGGYRLGAGAEVPPLLLDDEEAVAVALGLCMTASGGVAGLPEAAARTFAKLDQLLPARLRGRVRALHATIVPLGGPGPLTDPDVLSALAGACRDRDRLRFAYVDRVGAPSERNTEPCGLVHTGRRFSLVAWDLDRAAFRTFRIDRIVRVDAVGPTFPPREPPDADLGAWVARSISSEAHAEVARVVLHAPLEVVADRVSPTSGTLEAIDASRCRLTTGARSVEMLAGWIGMLGVDFEVESPPALIEHLRALAERFARAV